MKYLTINFLSKTFTKQHNTIVYIDGQKIKSEIVKRKDDVYTYASDKDRVNVKIVSFHQADSKWFYFISIFYFLISVFGIFDIRPNKKGMAMVCEFDVAMQESGEIKLCYNKFLPGTPALKIDTDLDIKVIENKFFIDEVVVKRVKTAKYIKLSIFLTLLFGSIAAGIICLVLVLI